MYNYSNVMNTYTSAKAERQAAILEIVGSEDIATQTELAKALKKRKISATQVSVSRDMAELGLVKAGGFYRQGNLDTQATDPEAPLRASLKSVEPAGPNLLVLKTVTGMAQPVGLVVDAMTMEGLVGTIAGDDTVFLAVKDAATSKRVLEYLTARIKA